MAIHPTAIIDPKAEIDPEAEIGPNVVVEANVKVGKGVKVWANAYLCGWTEIGANCQIHMGAVIGHLPQDLSFKHGKSYLVIGKNNVFREYATIHRGTEEGSATVIGDDNYFMGLSHVGHNCRIGNRVVICNTTGLAGYVTVEDSAFISAGVGIHQFARIGKLAMIGALARVNKDVPPYMLVEGNSTVRALNTEGLRRANLPVEVRDEIKSAYKLLYRSGLNTAQALEAIEAQLKSDEVRHLIDFIKGSKRGICKHK